VACEFSCLIDLLMGAGVLAIMFFSPFDRMNVVKCTIQGVTLDLVLGIQLYVHFRA
jgi:hypothetical protein